jgi:hypothetical protein
VIEFYCFSEKSSQTEAFFTSTFNLREKIRGYDRNSSHLDSIVRRFCHLAGRQKGDGKEKGKQQEISGSCLSTPRKFGGAVQKIFTD